MPTTLMANPFPILRRFTEEVDRAFGFKPDFPNLPEFYTAMWTPAIEVFERDNKYYVRAELPGLTKDNVKVEAVHDELTIEGERKLEKEEKDQGFYRTERNYGKFYRRIPIPDYVKGEAAVATFKNGVLEIEMPVIPVPEAKKRILEIQG